MAKLFTSAQIREIDAFTISTEPIASIDLMERAATALSEWIIQRYDSESSLYFFAGPGNNGGDAWALARLLFLKGYKKLSVFELEVTSQLSADAATNKGLFIEQTHIPVIEIRTESDFPIIPESTIVIDGLFGSGLSRPLEGLALKLVHFLNTSSSQVIAIDIPSGLFGEDNSANLKDHMVRANFTLTFQFPKLSFFFPENENYVGEWHILDIGLHPEIINNTITPYYYISSDNVNQRLLVRKKFSHKGNYGHALLIAGSYGMMGAAILSAKAVVRTGAGLLTTHVPRAGVDLIHMSVPESLVSVDSSETQFSHYPPLGEYSSIGIGPGIGKDPRTKEGLIELLQETKTPLLIDADGLNLLATIHSWEQKLPGNSILTPHPKEFERLFGAFTNSFSRLQAQLDFSAKWHCVIVLKGAYTCITTPDGNVWFNTTGNPGMAKGGSGDVLTGMILGLLAQGYSVTDATIIGVFLHGVAGDIAAGEQGQHAMIPSDLLNNIGEAFNVIDKTKTRP